VVPVVNPHVTGVMRLPAGSRAPLTVTEYVWLPTSSGVGFSVAVRVGASYVTVAATSWLLEFLNCMTSVAL
jgi:hypothetical protein